MGWCPKCRKNVFDREDVRDRAKQMIKEIRDEYRFEFEGMEVEPEHLHMPVSVPPFRSIGEVVRIIKSPSEREILREFSGLKKGLVGGELWEDRYFSRTGGDRLTRDLILEYTAHHRDLELR
ncbi:MAG: IS200/IS605 family transposase, partial [Candidatus Aminicenantales bacterium]